MTLVSRWWAVWRETQLDETLLLTSSGTSGPLSRTSKYHIQREDDLPQRYFQLWQECIFFLWHHEKRNERPEHWLPLNGGKSCCLPNCLPCFCLPFSSSLSGFFALKSPALHVAPVLNSPHWQNCIDRPRSNLCLVSAQASETASARWSSEWQAVTLAGSRSMYNCIFTV